MNNQYSIPGREVQMILSCCWIMMARRWGFSAASVPNSCCPVLEHPLPQHPSLFCRAHGFSENIIYFQGAGTGGPGIVQRRHIPQLPVDDQHSGQKKQ
jgi:hypothetical protein